MSVKVAVNVGRSDSNVFVPYNFFMLVFASLVFKCIFSLVYLYLLSTAVFKLFCLNQNNLI